MDSLYRQIRYAQDIENPSLFSELFSCALSCELDQKNQWRVFLFQFHLLLDTMSDEAIPPHWRLQCLDHIYQPLFKLRRLASCKEQNREINQLYHELRVMSNYVRAGLAV